MKKCLFFIMLFSGMIFAQWMTQTTPLSTSLSNIQFSDNNTGWAIGPGGGIRTSDGGSTWTTVGPGYSFRETSFIDQNTAFSLVSDNYIYFTSNGGTSWSMKTSPFTTYLGSIHFLSSTLGFAGGNNGFIFKTTNGGTNWLSIGAGGFFINDLVFMDENNGWVCRPSGGWSKTTDGGVNWINGTAGSESFAAICLLDMNDVLLGGGNGVIYKTTNGGTSWTQAVTGTTSAIYDFYAVDGSNIWAAGTSGTILHSTDGGSTWSAQTTGSSSNLSGICMLSNSLGWACGSGGTILKYTQAAASISLDNPAGGEIWEVGSTQNILWSSSGISNIKLEYSTDNGANWITISASAAASAGSFPWLIPNTPSAQCKLRISDAANAMLNETIEGNFTIQLTTVNLTAPNGGEEWQAGSVQNITWTSTGVANVKLQYSTDNGLNWTDIITSTAAAAGSYSWTVPNNPSTNCKIKILNSANAAMADESNATFTISPAPSITLTSPNGGEVWHAGSVQNITWTSTGVTNVKLQYSTDNGLIWTDIVTSTAASGGSYSWTVPGNPSANCKVKVINTAEAAIADESNATFTISPAPSVTLTSPNGGEDWQAGSVQNITFASTGVANIKLQYSTDNGLNWTDIIASTAAAGGSYSWTVPSNPSINCKVKVISTVNSAVADESNSTFTISPAPSVTLTSPNGGEDWQGGTVQNITWTSSGVENVKLQYYTTTGLWKDIIASTPASAGSYQWIIPNEPSVTCKVRILSLEHGGLQDESNSTFTISVPSVTITSPNGGEDWQGGTVQNITWTSTGITNVKLQYYTTAGLWKDIITSTPAFAGSYPWTIPNEPSVTCKVRIVSLEHGGLQDESNGTFKISPANSLILTSPNGGENWKKGSVHNITWTSVNVNNIKIDYSTDGGIVWGIITNSAPAASGKFEWTVPATLSQNCKILISDADNPSLVDVSDSTFTIYTSTIVLISPNGGEMWKKGSLQNITWTSLEINNIKIDYSTDGGTVWGIITNSFPAASGKYEWSVPATPSENCRIFISDADNPEVADVSDSAFTIYEQTLTLLEPNGGKGYYADSVYDIKWTSKNVNKLRIMYSTHPGSSWLIIDSAADASSGKYSWKIPGTISGTCLLRIVDAENAQLFDESTEYFSILIPQLLKLTSPSGGEKWLYDFAYDITWVTNLDGNVQISGSTNMGRNWFIISTVPASQVKYKWKIRSVNSSINCLIKISSLDYSLSDRSASVFSIGSFYLTIPNGNENWTVGSQKTITWGNIYTPFESIRIEYSTNDGSSWIVVAENTPVADKNYSWSVPNTPSERCRIKISAVGNPLIADSSTYTFKISSAPYLAIISPAGGERWLAGSQQVITWNTSSVANVKLEYTTNNGTSWNIIAASTPSRNSSFTWSLPRAEVPVCRVRIVDVMNSAVADTSNSFTITASLVELHYPNGGEKLFAGSMDSIKWISQNAVTNKLYFSSNNGRTWSGIDFNVPDANKKYSWQVPNLSSSNCLVKIKDANNNSSDSSNAVFSIASLKLISPNGGELWNSGTTQSIVWTSGNIANITLEYTTNLGITWTKIQENIPNAVNGNGRYDWLTPTEISSSNCKIRISEFGSAKIKDESDNLFSVTSASVILLNFPTGGENLYSGETYEISWRSGNVQTVKIQYTTNGTDWTQIASDVPAAPQKYSWTLNNLSPGPYKIRVSDKSNPAAADESGLFTIAQMPVLALLNPNGGDTLLAGKNYEIKWESTGVESFQILASYNFGAARTTWDVITSSTPASQGKYIWKVPERNSSKCKIKIIDLVEQEFSDISEQTFSIKSPDILIESPNGSEQFEGGSSVDIKWFSRKTIPYVKIEYSLNKTKWITIANKILSANSKFTWKVPEILTNSCLIRITSADDRRVFDVSDSAFTITSVSAGRWYQQDVPEIEDDHHNSGFSTMYFFDDLKGFAAGTDLIIKTTNGGFTWGKTITDTHILDYLEFKDITFINSQIGYAVGEEGLIQKTNNGGFSWENKSLNEREYLNSVSFISADLGYVAARGGSIYKTTNGGQTWILRSNGLGGLYRVQFLTENLGWGCGYLQGDGIILNTFDGGSSWNIVYSIPETCINSICLVDEENLYAVGQGGLFVKTTDGGKNWTKHTLNSSSLNCVEFQGTMFGIAVGGHKIFLTSDGGNSWKEHEYSSNRQLYSAKIVNSGRMWVAGAHDYLDPYGTILKFGQPTLEIKKPVTGAEIQIGKNFDLEWSSDEISRISAFYLDPSGEKIPLRTRTTSKSFTVSIEYKKARNKVKIIVEDANNTDIADTIIIKTSLLENRSWTNQYLHDTLGVHYSIKEMMFANDMQGIIYVKAPYHYGYIYRTSDGGQNWIKAKGVDANQVFLANSGVGWYSEPYNNDQYIYTYKTTDYGVTWSIYSVFEGAKYLYFFNESEGWRINDDTEAIEKTSDGGQNWTEQGTFNIDGYLKKIRFWGNHGSAWGAGKLMLNTSDRGNTWTINPLADETIQVSDISFINETCGWMCGYDYVHRKGFIKKSINGGKNWITIYELENVSLNTICAASSNKIWVGMNGGILKSTNGGRTWTKLDCGTNISSIYFINQLKGWIADSYGNLFYTTTGGGLQSTRKDITESEPEMVTEFSLSQNYPNPFNLETNITYGLPSQSKVKLEVYSMLGEKLDEIVNQVEDAGCHTVKWDAGYLASGVYLLRIEAESLEITNTYVKTLKMILMK